MAEANEPVSSDAKQPFLRRHARSLIVAVVLSAALAIPFFTKNSGIAGSLKSSPVSTSVGNDHRERASQQSAEPPLITSGARIHQEIPVATSYDRPIPPDQLDGFWGWDADKRSDVVSAVQFDSDLPEEVRSFLERAIQDRQLEAVTRNNMANAILTQATYDAQFVDVLIAMINDRNETYQWREYAVQHLAVAARTSQRRDVCVSELWHKACEGELGIPGTAMLTLHRLETDHFITLDMSFERLLIERMQSETSDLLTRMTAVSIAGERQVRGALPVLRELSGHAIPSLRRVAIAALGTFNDLEDDGAISAALRDPDPTVVAAAESARTRLLNQRSPVEGTRGPVPSPPQPAASSDARAEPTTDTSF